MNKNINCQCSVGAKGSEQRCEHNVRYQIKQFTDILDHFYTDEGFDEFCNLDTIQIMIGSAEHTAETYLCPETWEAIYDAITIIICHLIEANELDKYPYYDRMIDRFSKELGVSRGNFVN